MKMCDCNQGRLPCTCKMVEMVSVPRELAETFDRSESPPPAWAVEKLRAILDAPAELNQGEPVKIPARDESLGTAERDEYANGYRHGWNAYNDELAKLGPLYIRPAQGDPAAFVSPATLEAIKASGTRVHWVSSERNMEDCVPLYTHPAPAQQGEPVAWQVTWPYGPRELFQDEVGAKATMAPYQPLYTHPDSGEVERLREEVDHLQGIRQSLDQTLSACITKREDLRAQLSERDALLRGYHSLLRQVLPCLAMSTNSQAASYMRQIDAALSASAEPIDLEEFALRNMPKLSVNFERKIVAHTQRGDRVFAPVDESADGGMQWRSTPGGGVDGGHPITISSSVHYSPYGAILDGEGVSIQLPPGASATIGEEGGGKIFVHALKIRETSITADDGIIWERGADDLWRPKKDCSDGDATQPAERDEHKVNAADCRMKDAPSGSPLIAAGPRVDVDGGYPITIETTGDGFTTTTPEATVRYVGPFGCSISKREITCPPGAEVTVTVNAPMELKISCRSVEIDERAEFEADCLLKGFAIDLLPSGRYLIPAVRFGWEGWQARAALERKP